MRAIWAAAIAVLFAGCEFGHFIRRQVPATASDGCIRESLQNVGEISEIREVAPEGRNRVFYWVANGAGDRADGWVTTGNSALVLETGHLNGHPCQGIAYGKTILDAIFEQLRGRCAPIPDAASIREECLGIGTCGCTSDRRFR